MLLMTSVVLCALAGDVEVSQVEPPNTVVWIEPMAGWFGRAGVGIERTLGSRVSIWADAGVWFHSSDFVFAATPDERQHQATTSGGLGIGLRIFPRAGAPSGFWLGPYLQASYGRVRSTTLSFDQYTGVGSVQAGWTHVFSSGLAVHGALGLSAGLNRMVGDVTASDVSVWPSLWLGAGYAF